LKTKPCGVTEAKKNREGAGQIDGKTKTKSLSFRKLERRTLLRSKGGPQKAKKRS